mmetsp:Transcript_3748/g.10589  ORF Transcript_3748/g.10589 Transcript_3748/m.10589 type:complete len:165 (-) Transcript_3748:1159-1653(-)
MRTAPHSSSQLAAMMLRPGGLSQQSISTLRHTMRAFERTSAELQAACTELKAEYSQLLDKLADAQARGVAGELEAIMLVAHKDELLHKMEAIYVDMTHERQLFGVFVWQVVTTPLNAAKVLMTAYPCLPNSPMLIQSLIQGLPPERGGTPTAAATVQQQLSNSP